MNTFLPYSDFTESAQCLDNKRLGKQRVEAWQIYCALTKENYGWKHHPIVKMWKGYEKTLLSYGLRMCVEWKRRGFKDNMIKRFSMEFMRRREETMLYPIWLYDDRFIDGMRSNLLRKNYLYYFKFGWNVPNNLPYYWDIK